jgi:hypothetical protein
MYFNLVIQNLVSCKISKIFNNVKNIKILQLNLELDYQKYQESILPYLMRINHKYLILDGKIKKLQII